jgi:hypothetical protein
VEQVAYGDLLGLSYDQTKVGLTKATEERAWGFREIADTYNIEVGPVEAAGTMTYSGENRHIVKFGQAPAAYRRKVDITSLHVALTPAACNIHIDNVGFVLRGSRSMVGLDPDFVQHLVNELLLKTILRDWLIEKYGDTSTAELGHALCAIRRSQARCRHHAAERRVHDGLQMPAVGKAYP